VHATIDGSKKLALLVNNINVSRMSTFGHVHSNATKLQSHSAKFLDFLVYIKTKVASKKQENIALCRQVCCTQKRCRKTETHACRISSCQHHPFHIPRIKVQSILQNKISIKELFSGYCRDSAKLLTHTKLEKKL
jgi:hypothetical protein